jgi:hypothetical protein
MKESYPSPEEEEKDIAALTWRAFKAASIATNFLFDRRYFDRRFIGDDDVAAFNDAIIASNNNDEDKHNEPGV